MAYQRLVDPDGDDSLARLLRRVPREGAILELGPATGYCTRYLAETLGCTVDAIEISPAMAEQVRPWCRSLIVGDVEALDLAHLLPRQGYSAILCADVLEHLRDPWTFLGRLRDLLADDGRLLLSVPNVGYLGLLVDLLRGNFSYRNEGLLDRTHLRFFTLASLKEALEAAGWHPWHAEQVPLSLTDSEFRVRIESVVPALADEFLARPDAFCYQWIVEARATPPARPFVPESGPREDSFQVRAFWRPAGAAFEEMRNRLVWGALGRRGQTLMFDIPTGQAGLALRLSNRTGLVRLQAMRLCGSGGGMLWEWTPSEGALPVESMNGMLPADEAGLWYVSTTDSRLDLALAPEIVSDARQIAVTIDSPISPDYLAAEDYWRRADGLAVELLRQVQGLKAESERLAGQLAATQTDLSRLKADAEAQARTIAEQQGRLQLARLSLGEDESSWIRTGRAARLARRLPGLLPVLDRMARLRARLRGHSKG